MEITVYASVSGMTWYWKITAGGTKVASSLNGDGAFVGFETRESALADACKVAMEMFPVKGE